MKRNILFTVITSQILKRAQALFACIHFNIWISQGHRNSGDNAILSIRASVVYSRNNLGQQSVVVRDVPDEREHREVNIAFHAVNGQEPLGSSDELLKDIFQASLHSTVIVVFDYIKKEKCIRFFGCVFQAYIYIYFFLP